MTKYDTLQAELGTGEKLLWSEEPNALGYLTIETAFPLVFGILWILMVSLSFSYSNHDSDLWPYFFISVGLAITGSGLWSVMKPCFTIYGITDQRLVIVRRYPWTAVTESYFSTDIDFTRKTRNRQGNGRIVFCRTPHNGRRGRTYYRDVGFFGIVDVDSVEKLIRDTFRKPIPSDSA